MTARLSLDSDHAHQTLSTLLTQRAQATPAAPALSAPDREPLTYSDLQEQTARLSGQFRALEIAREKRVAVVLPNGPEMAAAFLAVANCAVCVPLNPACTAAELDFAFSDMKVDFVLLLRGQAGNVRNVAAGRGLRILDMVAGPGDKAGRIALADPPAAPVRFDEPGAAADIALLLHTSGTTGQPKTVPLSQSNLLASAHNIAAHLSLTPADRCLNVMPLFHIHGLVGALLATLAGGGSIVCTGGFDDDAFVDWIVHCQPSWYTAVPTLHQAFLAQAVSYRARAPAHRFRFVRSSSAALPAATLRQLQSLLQAPVVEAYGMTEASHQMTSNPVAAGAQTAGSVGRPAGADVAILDTAGHHLDIGQSGEIAVRGAGLMRGYENNPQANAAAFSDGWFRTGDLGHLDDQGRLFIAGRLKDIVNRGGEKISPREVDDTLLEHPDVAQAAAFGTPHPTLGEDLAAAVVLRAGSSVDETALRAFLFTRLSDFKVPSRIMLVKCIPTGATGKIQRGVLHHALLAMLPPAFEAPCSATECAVELILRTLLGDRPLGLQDNFFFMGGDSLSGARAVARVNSQFGLDLPAMLLFRHPTVGGFAAAVQTGIDTRAAEEATWAAEIDALSDEEVERLLALAEAGMTAAIDMAPAGHPQTPTKRA